MNLRRLSALPLSLLVFLTMVVAPYAVARCAHDDGETHLHALGSPCAEDNGSDRMAASGKKNGAACKTVPSDDVRAAGNTAETPPVLLAPAPHPFVITDVLISVEAPPTPPATAPPRPDETTSRGAAPLLI